MSWIQTPTKFRAVDAERITGISRDLQRSLRRRGFLPQNDGWAAFEVADLAFLFVIGRLAMGGIGPKAAERIADTASKVIKVRAQELPGAVFDPNNLKGDEPLIHLAPAVRGGRGFPRERFLVTFVDSGEATYTDQLDSEFTGQGRDVALVIDLQRVAETLLARADRPLVTISEG